MTTRSVSTAAYEPRREAGLAVVPLLVVALGFITPPIIPAWMWPPARNFELPSPFADGPSLMWSFQIGAVLLAVITLARVRGASAPGALDRAAAALATLGVIWLPVVTLVELTTEVWSFAIASTAFVVVPVAALVQSFRVRGWRGWIYALGAWAIAAIPYACPFWMGMFNVLSGGVTFAAAELTLLVLVAFGLGANRNRRQPASA
jgi:hypothetical protein